MDPGVRSYFLLKITKTNNFWIYTQFCGLTYHVTWQFSQHGPLAHSASFTSLHVIGSQHGSRLLQSSNDPQSHSSPSSITPLPQFRREPSYY